MAVAFYPSLPLNLTYCSALRRELERNLLSLIFVRISNLSTVSRAMFRYVSSRGPRATSYFSPSPFFLFFLPSIPLSSPVLRFSLLSLVPHRDTPDLPLLSFSFFFFNCSHFRGVGRITASNVGVSELCHVSGCMRVPSGILGVIIPGQVVRIDSINLDRRNYRSLVSCIARQTSITGANTGEE